MITPSLQRANRSIISPYGAKTPYVGLGILFSVSLQSLSASIIKIDFSGTITTLNAPFVTEALFAVGSTLNGYYIYDDAVALTSSAFPALIEFKAELTRPASPIHLISTNGDLRLTNNFTRPFGLPSQDFDQFRIDANIPNTDLEGAYFNGVSLYMRGPIDTFSSNPILSDASYGILNNSFTPYLFNVQAPSGSIYGVVGEGSFIYSATLIPEFASSCTLMGLCSILFAVNLKARSRRMA